MTTEKKAILGLKEEIKQAADEGRALNTKIQAASGLDRHLLRREKKSAGARARYLLLAYAILRGREYQEQERHTADGNRPYVTLILDAATSAGAGIARESIETWLKPKEAVPSAASDAA